MNKELGQQIQYHILNGDALKDQFPTTMEGNIIVARECLIEGSLHGENLTEFFDSRAEFIHQSYPKYSTASYHENVATEFQAILDIPEEAEINLWFEDDLFCQTNLWFVCSLLNTSKRTNRIYLIRPEAHSKYGFGRYNQEGLIRLYDKRIRLTDIETISLLWKTYKEGNNEQLLAQAQVLKKQYPFIIPSVEAQLARIPNEQSIGLPKEVLLQIMSELDTKDFGIIFKEFNERLPIYGFGDSQVYKLLKELNSSLS